MYAYLIYRRAIEWAFEDANLPIVKLSPWRYEYDAGFTIRHDLENTPGRINFIKSSAQAEYNAGAKGDYYLCTGTVRAGSEDTQMTEAQKLAAVANMRDAVEDYGATIGSHNGGLPNPTATYPPNAYNYWHWGPDQALNVTPTGYLSGWQYAYTSVLTSYLDIEGWLVGLDNGRVGCGTAGTCPRTWVSPAFNSGREGSFDIMADLDVVSMGEQKLSPFPHWTLSTDTPEVRHQHISLPVSDWYTGTIVAQSMEAGHTSATIHALVDFYYDLGTLINLYNHSSSASGLANDYLNYTMSKPRVWATNAVGIYDWWTVRSDVVVTPSYRKVGETVIAEATISGATDPETAIELVIPYWEGGAIDDVQVFVDGALADPAEYRFINGGVKVKVGTTISQVAVHYTPLEGWVQTDWVGGPGQAAWSDVTRYDSATGIDDTFAGQARLSITGGGDVWFSDTFTRTVPSETTPFTWITPTGSTAYPNKGTFVITDGVLYAGTSALGPYGYAFTNTVVMTDHSVEADIRFPTHPSFKGGGGIFGRLNEANGQRYAAWIYPDISQIRLLKFYNNWGSWNSPGFATYSIPGGFNNAWHHLKMTFTGNTIEVFYDGTRVITDTDAGMEPSCATYSSCAPYASGYPGIDLWTNTTSGSLQGPAYNNFTVRDSSGTAVFVDDFGADPPDPLLPWVKQLGTWQLADETLQSTTKGAYGYVYTSTTPLWTDYSVEGRVQLPAGAYGGGIGGRLDPATGAHYGAWIYSDGSTSPNVLKLIKFRDWTNWSGTPMGGNVSLPDSVGTGWHTLRLDFKENRIRVYYDDQEVLDYTDTGYDSRPAYLSGGITVDSWAANTYSGPYVIAADDIIVRSPTEYGSVGTLLSSAFDGGVGVQWEDISWNAAVSSGTGVRMRTRTADRANLLTAAPWSDWYTSSGTPVANEDRRWIQYEVELTSSDTDVTPVFYEHGITYIPGIMLPGSNLTYTGPAAGDSHAQAALSATLLDDEDAPIVGRTVTFTLDGLSSVAGVTDGSGQASAPLDLLTAPGPYSLTVAFAGDTAFAPVSIVLPFEVTSPWSEWIQDTQTDFQSDTLTDTDALTLPGSVLLEEQLVGEGEESGSFSVGGVVGWTYRRRLFIDNNDASVLPSGYSVRAVLDTEGLVSAGKLQAGGDDLRIAWYNGTEMVELDRVAETAFNSAATEIWFATQEPIPAETRDLHYYLYYGNPSAGSPPADPAEVYALWDTFDGGVLDSSLWSPTGTVTVSGGQAHLASGANIIGTTPYTYGIVEMSVQLVADNNYAWWGWEDGTDTAPNFTVFEEFPTTGFEAIHRNDGATYTQLLLADPTGGLKTWHTYQVDWRPGHTAWSIDGVEATSATTNLPDSYMYPIFYGRAVAMDVDWVKVRLYAAEEPTVALATPYLAYPDEGEVLSIAYDTGQFSTWKYLTWEESVPAGADVQMYVRTAATQVGLVTAPWVAYDETGHLISNDPGRWVQYRARLSTMEPLTTPVLHKVTVYYTELPATLALFPDPKTVAAGESVAYTARVNADGYSWDVTPETSFSIESGAQGSWADVTYTSQTAGDWNISGSYADLNGSAVLHVQPAIGLVITKQVVPAPVRVGTLLTYTIMITNTGPSGASGVSLEDELPVGVILLSATASQGSGCTGTETVICDLGDLAKDASATVQLVARPTATGTVVNTARVSGADPQGNGVQVVTPATVEVVRPEIALSKLPVLQTVAPGAEVTFTIRVTNTGDVALSNVGVSDPLAPDCDAQFATLIAGQYEAYSCTLADVGADFVNRATVTGTAAMVNAVVTAEASASVDVLPSLVVTKTAAPETLPEPGGLVTFTVEVENLSAEAVTLTRLVDDVHGDLDDQGTCTVPQALSVGESYTCAFSAQVTGNAGAVETDVITAAVEDDEGNGVEGKAQATVGLTDVPSGMTVSKVAEPDTLAEPGGWVTFTVRVNNTSLVDTVTLNSLTDDVHGNLDDQGTCSVPQTIAAGSSYECAFSGLVSGNAGYSETDIVTAAGTDDDGNTLQAQDSATVTVVDVASGLTVSKVAEPDTVAEPGGWVTFTVRVNNTSVVDAVTINSLTDDVHGNLDDQGTCSVPQDIIAGSFYECAFSALVSGNAGYSETDIVTAAGTDDDGNPVQAQDSAKVTVVDVASGLTVGKVADPDTVAEPGGWVTFTVRVNNASLVDAMTLTELSDDVYGDLDDQGTCSVPQDIAAGSSYECAFSALVNGNAGHSETDTVTAAGTDDDGNTLQAQASATVTVVDVPSGMVVSKAANPDTLSEPGGWVTFTVRVNNTSSVDGVTLNSLTDDVHGDLNGQGTCVLPQDIAAANFYECAFSALVSGNAGASATDLVTAAGVDDDGNALQAQDSATVTIVDVPSDLVVHALVEPASLPEPGGTVTFTVRVTNTSSVDVLTLTGLTDDRYGDLEGTGTCLLPQTLAVGGSYACEFNVTIMGVAGATEKHVITASGQDDDGEPFSESAEATITLVPFVPPVTSYEIYLPAVFHRQGPAAPNLVVERISVDSGIQVVVKNIGGTAVRDAFWVDMYVNPVPVPTGVNQFWADGRSTQGGVWGVDGAALPLQPGATLTLRVGDEHYWGSLSQLDAVLPVGTVLYVQVDSANMETTYGAVLEDHEISSGSYDNIGHLTLLHGVTIGSAKTTDAHGVELTLPLRP